MRKITTAPPRISDAERTRRQEAIDFARGSVRLEGFILSPAVEELNRRYVEGELSSEEHSVAIRKHHGV